MQRFNQLSFGDQDKKIVDISINDKVLKNPLLLSRIAGFLRTPPAPREKTLLSLRLLSTQFNEAVMGQVGSGEILVRLTISNDMVENSFLGLDGRLCRDVLMKTCNNFGPHCHGGCAPLHPHLASRFFTFVAEHGFKIQILNIDHQVGVALGTMLTQINEGCPNLSKLTIKAKGNPETVASLADWNGHFAHSMTALVNLEVSSNLRGEYVERHVSRVVNSFLQATPNLQKLLMQGDFSLVVDTLVRLKCLKHSYSCGPPRTILSCKSMMETINSVANSLETLEISHFDTTGTQIQVQSLPIPNAFPCLKNVSLQGTKCTAVILRLWDHILNSGAPSLETVVVKWINFTVAHPRFWIPLFSSPQPLTTVTKLSLYGDLCHHSSQSERLRRISRAFPNLSEFIYSLGSKQYGREDIERDVRDMFQELVDGWQKPLKKVQIDITRECSIHVVTAAMGAIEEAFFTNGLETLSISARRPNKKKDWEAFTSDEQLNRLTRILLWTRNMESVKFHLFRIPDNVAGTLRDFISSNGLPVVFDKYDE